MNPTYVGLIGGWNSTSVPDTTTRNGGGWYADEVAGTNPSVTFMITN
jgi:hypothetical protein